VSNWKHGGDDQMTVGEILAYLSHLPKHKPTRWAFSCPHSYRGYYEQVAIMAHDYESTVGGLIEEVTMCLSTFTGWKGGEYTMDRDTPVWVASAGNTGFPLTWSFLDLVIGD
jgi:hypothetical protein